MKRLLLALLLLALPATAQVVNLPPGGAATVTCIATAPPNPDPPDPGPPNPGPPGNCIFIGDLGWSNGNPLHVNYIANQDYCYTIAVPNATVQQFSVRTGEVPGTPTGTNRMWLVDPNGTTVAGPSDFNNKYGSLSAYAPIKQGQWILHVAPNYQGPNVTQLNH